MTEPLHLACLGGGHGLYQTLLAVRELPGAEVSAIVTVADDGGSSGRLRRELGIIPPGDLRMAVAALADREHDGGILADTLQHRFRGNGALAGHAVGNLLIAGLVEMLGDMQAALDRVMDITRSRGRVLPVVNIPLDIEAEVAGLDDNPMSIRPVRGQVAVAKTPGNVHRVRIIPPDPAANPRVIAALQAADVITIGPGSWFTSVIPHVLVPEVVTAINASTALRVLVLNLTAEPGETRGFSSERHIHVLSQHAPGLRVDLIVVDEHANFSAAEKVHLQRAANALGATVVFADLCECDGNGQPTSIHDPRKLGATLLSLLAQHRQE